jgi:hypothetical protein
VCDKERLLLLSRLARVATLSAAWWRGRASSSWLVGYYNGKHLHANDVRAAQKRSVRCLREQSDEDCKEDDDGIGKEKEVTR